MDRKALKQQYKETVHPMGVYRVHNTVQDRSFVGTNVNLTAARSGQWARLQMKGHPNTALQEDWNRLGADAFVFEVLDTLPPSDRPGYNPADDLKTLEELWLDKLSATGEGVYNKWPRGK